MTISVYDRKNRGNIITLYGRPDAGKTFALGTIPREELVILDFDGGPRTIESKNPRAFTLTNLETDFPVLFNVLSSETMQTDSNDLRCKYLAIDTLTGMESSAVHLFCEKDNKTFPALPIYGKASAMVIDCINQLANLRLKGITIILTAHEREIEQARDEGIVTKSIIAPALLPSVYRRVAGISDMIIRLYKKRTEDGYTRVMQFRASNIADARTRIAASGDFQNDNDLYSLLQRI